MIARAFKRVKAGLRKWDYAFISLSIAAGLMSLFLAVKLTPWFYAVNTHVRLYMDAPAQTKIHVCWDKSRTQCLPLVPYSTANSRVAEPGEVAEIWMSELPPRPAYSISLTFRSSVVKARFHDLELDSWPGILWGSIPGAGVQDTRVHWNQLESQDIAYALRDGLYYIDAARGARVMMTAEIEPGHSGPGNQMTIMLIWALLFSVYLLFAVPLYLLPFAVQNLGVASRDARRPNYPWWAYVLCGMAIVIMLLLTIKSPVMLYGNDQMVYLHVAIRRAWLFYPARPPGYYMFVALALWLSSYNLGGVVLLQIIFLAFSATSCLWALRKWVHPFVAVAFMFLVLLSPAQIYWALSIMRESIFASLVLLGITAVISHFSAPDSVAARIWLAVFSVVCALALLVRENGILLPVALLPALLPEAIKRLKSPCAIWKRMRSVFMLFVGYVGPALGTGVVYIALSYYNYVNYGYFQFTLHVTSHHFLWREIATASFDSRSLLRPDPSMSDEAKTYIGRPLYDSFILAREESAGADPIYVSLFPTVNLITSGRGQSVNWFHSASIIDEIGRSATTLMPWQANIVGLLRQYREFLVSNPSDSGRYPLLPDDPSGVASKRELLAQLERTVTYDAKPTQSGSIIGEYYDVTKDYGWYRPLFLLALLSTLYVLRFDDPVFLAPIAFFIANALLMIILRTEQPRYIESLDVLLILQVALALSRWIYRRSSPIPGKLSLCPH